MCSNKCSFWMCKILTLQILGLSVGIRNIIKKSNLKYVFHSCKSCRQRRPSFLVTFKIICENWFLPIATSAADLFSCKSSTDPCGRSGRPPGQCSIFWCFQQASKYHDCAVSFSVFGKVKIWNYFLFLCLVCLFVCFCFKSFWIKPVFLFASFLPSV